MKPNPSAIPAAALLAGGYGCYQAANSSGYLTAMGTVSTNLGFVTSLPFMAGGCVTGAALALALAWRARRGPTRIPLGVLVLAYLLLALLPLGRGPLALVGLDGAAASLVLGSLRGLCTSCISLLWIALFVHHARRRLPVLYVATFGFSSLCGLAMRKTALSAFPAPAMAAFLLAASCACAAVLVHAPAPKETSAPEKAPAPAPQRGLIRPNSEMGLAFYASWLCLLVCEFVVGVTNTAVFNSDFSATMAGVDMSLCMLVAVALLAALLAVFRSAPDPTAVFKGCMPALLVVFSAMPLAADRLGPLAGAVMVICYDMLALTFSIYLVAFLRDRGYDPYLNAGVFVGVSNLTLLLGLSIGVGLNALWSAQGVPLLTLLAFVAIYPVGLALLFAQKAHGRREDPAPAGRSLPQAVSSSAGEPSSKGAPLVAAPPDAGQVENYYAASMAAFARDRGLTPRESQVCALLVRGRSAKFAAQELGITENTAWTHIKNLYAKCGVGTKQDLMDLFEKTARSQG
jgi:DNA-binding CsgD family transcriptional regulator